tara:strand:- start:309 stop:770 length:462 start_codon:yes stop_codon:yes gene_type:complete
VFSLQSSNLSLDVCAHPHARLALKLFLEVRKPVNAKAFKRVVSNASRRWRSHRFPQTPDSFALSQIPQRASTTLATRLALAVKVQIRVVVGPFVTVLARCGLIHQRLAALTLLAALLGGHDFLAGLLGGLLRSLLTSRGVRVRLLSNLGHGSS